MYNVRKMNTHLMVRSLYRELRYCTFHIYTYSNMSQEFVHIEVGDCYIKCIFEYRSIKVRL